MCAEAGTGAPLGLADPAVGLSAAEAAQRAIGGLANDYQPDTSRTVRAIIRANVATRFNALLGAMLVVILVVGPWQDSLFGLTLVANTAVGILQELRAKHTLDRLAIVTAPRVRVVRDGRSQEVLAADVVIGDVVELGSGDQVAVDCEVLTSSGLQVDESLLTGESRQVPKECAATVLSGSFVVGGSGRCRVTAVGASAYAAKLADRARRFTMARSELRDGINRVLRGVTWVLVPTAVLLFWSQLSRASSVADALRGSVAGTVTMVPEGLVLLTSVALAVGVVRLARSQVLARELMAVEGLARVDVLCLDKTGTLTTGELALDVVEPLAEADAGELAGALATLVAAEARPNRTLVAIGRAHSGSAAWPVLRSWPFTSAARWSGVDTDAHGVWLLGPPDVLLAHHDGPTLVLGRARELAEAGSRVLLLARAGGPPTGDGWASDVVPYALLGLQDGIRPEAAETLAFLRAEHVAVKVISGDDPATVGHLAARVGLDVGIPADGRNLPADPVALRAVAESTTIFGRVAPAQKRELIAALQAAGHTVAMIGDGVNDVLALKDADVGVAMGSGSSAARAVADLVVLDDSFAAFPKVVAEGRRVLANVERVARLFVTKTVYATLLAVAVGIMAMPFPFLPRHLTIISTLTIGVPGFVLALAPNHRRALPHFVARVLRFAGPAGAAAAVGTLVAYRLVRDEPGTDLATARTVATLVLMSIALWVLAILIRMGDDRARWLVPLMAGSFAAVLATPATRTFFALSWPRPLLWLAAVGVAALSGLVLELGWLAAGFLRPGRRGQDATGA